MIPNKTDFLLWDFLANTLQIKQSKKVNLPQASD